MNRFYKATTTLTFLLFILVQSSFAQVINTVAGTPGSSGFSGDGGAANSAQMSSPYSIAKDTAGNIYIADFGNSRIRKVTPSGNIVTFAGSSSSGYSGDGGAATSAKLNNPVGVAVDAAGNVYVADFGNSVIRKISTSGVITTVAGTGTAGYSGDGGAATSAKLYSPVSIAFDTSGNMYIADYLNHRIRKVNTSGIISTVAGNGSTGYGSDGVSATSTSLYFPSSVSVDAAGNIYISDNGNARVRKVNTSGIISTIAGTGTAGYSGDGGAATSAQINGPWGVTFDVVGNIYIADANNNRIRKVSPAGDITTYAGTGTVGHSGDAGLAIFANINHPANPIIDVEGTMYFAENNGACIRKIYGGQALSFDGTNDYADFGNILTSGSSYTEEAVVYANSATSNCIFGSYDHPMWLTSGHLASANNFSGNGFTATIQDTATFPTGVWVHVAVSYDSATSTMKLYKNGVLVASTTSAPSYTAGTMQMGAWNLSNYWNGYIDEVRIWNIVRTPSQIASNIFCDLAQQSGLVAYYRLNQGSPGGTNTDITGIIDYSGNGHCGVLHNFALTGSTSNFVAGKTNSCNVINTPMISLQGNSNNIVNGATATSTTNATNFGTASSSITKTYTIQNRGTASLRIDTILISGTASSEFAVTSLPAKNIAAGSSTTFAVTFTPSTAGVRSATVTVNNSACEMATFNYAVSGTGTCSTPITYNVTGGGTKCLGSSGVDVGMSNSQAGVRYQLRYGSSNLGSPVTGTGSAFSFGTKSLLGTYTVVATTASGGCVATMAGSATITNDIDGPVVITKTATAYLNALGVATISLSDVDSATTDNCVLVSRTLNRTTFTCADKGANTVILTALDNSGNLTNGNATVNVVDTIKPVVTTQNAVLYLDDNGLATVRTTDVELLSTDICGIAGRYVDKPTLNCSNIGTNTITLSVYDYSNNIGTGTATVTLYDTTRPEIVTRNITAYLDATGNVDITGLDVDGGSTDNCGIATRTLSKSHFTCADKGANTVTLTIADASGNSVSNTAIVTVADSVKPVVRTKNVTVYLTSFFSATIAVSDIDNGSTDNCAISNRSLSKTSFSCGDLGVNTVTLTVTDASGNVQTGTAIVTVLDTVKPVVNTQNAIAYLGASGTATVTPAAVDGGSTDNCSIANRTLNNSTFSCANLGANTVTLTVTDNGGNSQTGTATVTVIDTTRPVVHTRNIDAYLTSAGNVTINATDVDNNSTDNCSVVTRTLSKSYFNCSNVGQNTVTLTVADASGNSASGTATVTVIDTTHPNIVAHDATIYLNASGNATITPSDIDNGSSDNCSVLSSSLDITNFTCSNIGANTVQLTVVDNSGETITAWATVTVVDSTKPTVITRNVTAYLNASGTASITAANIDNGSTDNCGIASRSVNTSSFNCSSLGANTVILTVTDNSGNAQTGTAIVTVIDTTKPTVATRNINAYLNASGTVTVAAADVDNGSSDNCSIASRSLNTTSFNCSNVGANTVVLTVADNSGNSKTGTAIVTVVDTNKPTALARNITAYLNAAGNASITVADLDNGSTGSCTVTKTLNKTNFTCADKGANTVILTVSSGANNSTATAIVTVADTTKPTVVTRNITAYLNASGVASITASQIDNSSSDNCSIATRTLSTSSFNCSNIGVNTVTLTVTDNSGNSATGTATVTIVDTTKPTIATRNITAYLDAGSAVSITPADIDNGSSDNCSIASRSLNTTSFNCVNVGANTVILTVADNSGNVKTGSAIVTVVDTTKPVARAKNKTIYLSASGTASIIASDIDSSSSDNCTIASRSLSKTSFNCSNLGANTVTLTVTDNSGNISTATAIVTVVDNIAPVITCPAAITVTSGSTTPATTGTATATDNCSSPTISYTDVSTSSSITRTWKATDASGNYATCTQVITLNSMTLSGVVTNVSCNGGRNGSINLSVTGTTSTLSYTWSNGAHTQDIYSLAAGTYSVTVTDSRGSTATASFTVTEPTAIAISAVVSNETCNTSDNGAIDITVTGGTGPYSYTWTSGGCSGHTHHSCSSWWSGWCGSHSSGRSTSHSADLTDIEAGTYTVTVTDANGCTKTATYTVTEPSAIYASASTTNVSCNGGSNGAINLSVSGGAGSYSYTWSNGANTQDITGLTAGTYTVNITDANGCTKTVSYTITQPSAISLSASVSNVTCKSSATGAINLSVTGGATYYYYYTYYTYTWSNGAHTQDISGLTADTYSVTVTDLNGCTKAGTYTVTEPATGINPTASVTNVVCKGSRTGAINLSVSGGSGSYSYTWSTGAHTQDISGLAAGTYTVTITDGTGCTKTASYTVTEPSVALTASISVSPVYAVPTYGAAYTIYLGYGKQSDSLIASASGGTASYSYSWSYSSALSSRSTAATRLTPTSTATYTVTITDANGCTATKSQTINVIDVTCGKSSDNKVVICQINNKGKGHDICIDSSAVAAHLASGDHLGSCDDAGARVAVSNEEEPFIIKVFPNPTTGIFSVQVPSVDGGIQLEIIDMTGKTVAQRSIQDGTISQQIDFNLANSPRGMYFVKIATNGQTYMQKVILQ